MRLYFSCRCDQYSPDHAEDDCFASSDDQHCLMKAGPAELKRMFPILLSIQSIIACCEFKQFSNNIRHLWNHTPNVHVCNTPYFVNLITGKINMSASSV